VRVTGGSASSGEDGGPGVTYLEGLTISNLRIDNDCQQPSVCNIYNCNTSLKD